MDDKTLEQGQWLKLHVRITNLRDTPIRRFCDGIGWDIDTSSIFAPGVTWTGIAGTFKEHWMREYPLVIVQDAFTDYRPRKQGCGGDVGQYFQQPPGGVIEQTVVGLPRYQPADQPLPGGTFTVGVGFLPGIHGRPMLAEVSVPVTLAGGPVDYPAPGSLVDAALATPGFIEFLEQVPDDRQWANTTAAFWSPPYPVQPRFDPARQAPQGIMEIGLFADAPGADGYGEVIVDPWTGQSFGFHAG